LQARVRLAGIDEAVLYWATGVALVLAVLAAGAGSGNVLVGITAGGLAAAGAYLSWQMRHWGGASASPGGRAGDLPARRIVLLAALMAATAGSALQRLINWRIETDTTGLFQTADDVGLLLALRMSVLTVVLSFLLLKHEMLAFSLVPALTAFGLVGSRGDPAVVTPCFVVFLPAALVAVGQAVVLAGSPEVPPALGGQSQAHLSPARTRQRHWMTLAMLIVAIMVLGYVLFLPVTTLATQYRFQMLLPMTPGGFAVAPSRFAREAGGYGAFLVGRGPVVLTKTPVLTIKGPPAEFWRGEVFDGYTGTAWLRPETPAWPIEHMAPGSLPARDVARSEMPTAMAAGGLATKTIDLGKAFGAGGASRTVTHVVRAEVDMPYVFYSAGQIQRVTLAGRAEMGSPGHPLAWRGGAGQPGGALPEAIQMDRNGCVYAPGRLIRRGTRYEVVSIPLEMRSPAGARPSGGLAPRPPEDSQAVAREELWLGLPATEAEDAKAYMRIPLSAHRVADLARRVVGEGEARHPAADPSEKLAALVSYLQQNYLYTTDAPAVPLGEDAADYFLFRRKRGQCDLFATALALMARAVGIPTRLATGYAGGVYDQEHGRWVIREADAHAWVEAYLEPWGWVSVEATPVGGAASIPPLRRALLRIRFLSQDYAVTAATAASAIMAGLLVAVLWRRRSADRALRTQARADSRAAVVWVYVQLCQFLRRRGRPRRPSQTPFEFLAALESAPTVERVSPRMARGRPAIISAEKLAPVRDITELFVLARYSPAAVSQEAAQLAAQKLLEVHRAWRRTLALRRESAGRGS